MSHFFQLPSLQSVTNEHPEDLCLEMDYKITDLTMFPVLEDSAYDSNYVVVSMALDDDFKDTAGPAGTNGVVLVLLGTDDPQYVAMWTHLMEQKLGQDLEIIKPSTGKDWADLESCTIRTLRPNTKVVCATEFVQCTDVAFSHIILAGIPSVIHFSVEQFMEAFICYHSLLTHSTPPSVAAGRAVTLVDSTYRQSLLICLEGWLKDKGWAIPEKIVHAIITNPTFMEPPPSLLEASMYADMDEDTPAETSPTPPGLKKLTEDDINAIARHAAKSTSFFHFVKTPLLKNAHIDRDVVIALLHGTVKRLNTVHKKEKQQWLTSTTPPAGALAGPSSQPPVDIQQKVDTLEENLREKNIENEKLKKERDEENKKRREAEAKLAKADKDLEQHLKTCGGLQEELRVAQEKLREYEDKHKTSEEKQPQQEEGAEATEQQRQEGGGAAKEQPQQEKGAEATELQRQEGGGAAKRNTSSEDSVSSRLRSRQREQQGSKDPLRDAKSVLHTLKSTGVTETMSKLASVLTNYSRQEGTPPAENTKEPEEDNPPSIDALLEDSNVYAEDFDAGFENVVEQEDANAEQVAAEIVGGAGTSHGEGGQQPDPGDKSAAPQQVAKDNVPPVGGAGTSQGEGGQQQAGTSSGTGAAKGKGGPKPKKKKNTRRKSVDEGSEGSKSSPRKRNPKTPNNPKPKKPKLDKDSYPFKKFSDKEKVRLAANATEMCARTMSTAVESMPNLEGRELARALRQIATSSVLQKKLIDAFPEFEDLRTDVINLDTEEGNNSAEAKEGLKKFVQEYKDHYIVGVSFIQVMHLIILISHS